MPQNKHYGWVPDLPDHRDQLYSAPLVKLATFPSKEDLRPKCPPVYDQGQLGSCTANAIAAAVQFDLMKENKPVFQPSRLFIYYNERVIEGTVNSDSGAQIRDGIKSIVHQGDAPEKDWPYDIAKFMDKPPAKAYTDAKKHEAVSYQRVVTDARADEGLSRVRISVRVRIHRLRELRVAARRQHGRGADAFAE